MNIRLFNKPYWLRRFGVQKNINGYLVSDYQDIVLSANMHPMSTDSIQALPEGKRHIKHLEGHGEMLLRVADEKTHTKGDMLFYHGDWYECTSCQLWDHTMLTHFNYQFALIPWDTSETYDMIPPEGEPNAKAQEGGGGR